MMRKNGPSALVLRWVALALVVVLVAGIQMLSGAAVAGTAPEPVDIILRGGPVVTMDGDRHLYENGLVAIKGDRIVAVGDARELAARYKAKTVIDTTGKAVLPGLINTHTHVPMALFRGVADDLMLQEWLTKYIFPAEAKNVNREFVRAGTRLGCLEMIQGGTTCYVDMYYFEDEIAAVTEAAGMRAVLGETVIDFPVPDAKTPQEGLAYAENFIKKYKGNALITPAIAPHAPYTCSPDLLKAAKALSDKLESPLVTHLAEDYSEVGIITERYKARPVEHVEKLGILGPRTIAAHVIQVTPEEIQILKNRGVGVAHNPQSNMKLAAGVCPVPQMLKAGLAVGLGTDGAASNNDLSMFEEMDSAAKLHKEFSKDPTVVNAREALEMATIRGAQAIHLDKEIGSLETGKRADLIVVDIDTPHQWPVYNLYSTLVYATKAGDVTTSIINGKIVMRDRKVLTLNVPAIKAETLKYRTQILESLKK
ncbi:MAG: amidohydrolase [Blastocatellia bacterium]|nr:amidohydrolase [Blastocatellia bacterium]